MLDTILVKVGLPRQRGLEEDQLARREFVEVIKNGRVKQCFCLGLFRAMNIDFRFDDGHESRPQNLRRYFELLADNRFDASGIGLLDEGALLGSKDALSIGLVEQGGQL